MSLGVKGLILFCPIIYIIVKTDNKRPRHRVLFLFCENYSKFFEVH